MLEGKIKELEMKIKKKMPLKERRYRSACPDHKEMCEAIGEIAQEVKQQQKQKDPTGKKVLAIEEKYRQRREKLAQCTSLDDVKACKLFD